MFENITKYVSITTACASVLLAVVTLTLLYPYIGPLDSQEQIATVLLILIFLYLILFANIKIQTTNKTKITFPSKARKK